MQVLIELIAGLIALLAALALSQFGVDLHPDKTDREITRVLDCGEGASPTKAMMKAAPRPASAPSQEC